MKYIVCLISLLFCSVSSFAQLSQVSLSPTSADCGMTTTINFDVSPCNYDGIMQVELINEPIGVTPNIQNVSVSNGTGTFDITVASGITGSMTVRFTVFSVTNQNGCGTGPGDTIDFLNFALNCPPPSNDECANATPLSVGNGSCVVQQYDNSNWTSSGVGSSCTSATNDDVYFEFMSTNIQATFEFGSLPDPDMKVDVFDACNGSEIYCNNIQANNSYTVTGLGNNSSYIVRVSDGSGSTTGVIEFCVHQPCPVIDNIYADTGTLSWLDPTNWSLGIIPTICHNVIIPAGNIVELLNTESGECYSLQVDVNGELIVEQGALLDVVAPNN